MGNFTAFDVFFNAYNDLCTENCLNLAPWGTVIGTMAFSYMYVHAQLLFGYYSRRDENKSRHFREPILGMVKYFRTGHDLLPDSVCNHRSHIRARAPYQTGVLHSRLLRGKHAELIFGFLRVSNYVPRARRSSKIEINPKYRRNPNRLKSVA